MAPTLLANFKFASDGSGGTIVYDPPVTPSSDQNTAVPGPVVPSATTGTRETVDPMDLPGMAFNVQATLGYLPNGNHTGGIRPPRRLSTTLISRSWATT